MNLQDIFDSRKNKPEWNTSYPLHPNDWKQYRCPEPLSFHKEKVLSYYVHVPFCRQLCSFCEYSRMKCPNEDLQHLYIEVLERDIISFINQYYDIPLNGFDIGGGTPTSLSDDNFSRLLGLYRGIVSQLRITEDFEPSIEGSFSTITPAKIEAIANAGINRISLGMQSASSNILTQNNRVTKSFEDMASVLNVIHSFGIRKINLDLMYGLRSQTLQSLSADIAAIKILNPEQVTLYELRTNMINQQTAWNKDMLYEAYCYLYAQLTALGYNARFGQNTFSKEAHDLGVSSYLRHRMIDGTGYKGFGISAQSMCSEGLSYNIGKTSTLTNKIIESPTYKPEYIYKLPPQELAAKYILKSATIIQYTIKGRFMSR